MAICSIIILLGYVVQLAVGEERVCSSFCGSLGTETNPGKSCADIYEINKASREVSGDYWINTTTGLHQVYCDMELECGGHKGGWMRIADLDTSRGDDCPTEWSKITTPHAPSIDVCRTPNDASGCYSTTFTVNGTNYYKMCGKVRGYQKGSADSFLSSQRPHSIDNHEYTITNSTQGKDSFPIMEFLQFKCGKEELFPLWEASNLLGGNVLCMLELGGLGACPS